jgi:hypothetical protein
MNNLLFFLFLAFFSNGSDPVTSSTGQSQPIVSRVHWITIHAKTADTFDSLYHFLAKDLQIPVFFEPEIWGSKKYTAIYAGNVILEPCGPFDITPINGKERLARYNTLIFYPFESARKSAELIKNIGFSSTGPTESSLINVTVDELCTDNLPVHLRDSVNLKDKGRSTLDSLNLVLSSNQGGPIGFRYIEEVYIGYEDEEYLEKWVEFLKPLKSEDNLWLLPEKPNLRFIKSNRTGIRALVFKVESLEKAKQYLESKKMLGESDEGLVVAVNKNFPSLKIILSE